MSATAEKPTPETLKRRKPTIGAATDGWVETTRAIEGLKAMQSEYAKVLLAHADKTGRRTFKDKIAVVDTGGGLVLDGDAVREELPPDRFVEGDLLKRQKRGHALKAV